MTKEQAGRTEIMRAGRRANPRTRMDPDARREMILNEAVAFFSEHGFEAQTKELAIRLGVSQGLIFRYFGTKQTLVEEVYRKVFLERWSTAWEEGLKNRAVALPQRLETFYLSYFSAVDEHDWIRVSLYAGLAGHDIIARYIQTRVNRLLELIARELRVFVGQSEDGALDPLEYELVWHLHSTFIYVLVRKYVHHLPVLDDREAMVSRIVRNFLHEATSEVDQKGSVIIRGRPSHPEAKGKTASKRGAESRSSGENGSKTRLRKTATTG